MKNFAPHDRPREKLERLGAAGLGDNELLALVLGSGSRARNALDVANDLLHDVGGTHGLTRVAIDDLHRVAGIGRARAAQVLAAVVEQFGVVMLDTKHHLIRVRIIAIGTLDSTVVHPREVFREATAAAAAAIVLFHNHPSGDPAPSDDDLILTNRMLSAGMVMGIDVVDHIILGDQRYCSLLEVGAIPQRG